MGHKASATAEKHYTVRPLDLLAVHHKRIEAQIMEQAGLLAVEGRATRAAGRGELTGHEGGCDLCQATRQTDPGGQFLMSLDNLGLWSAYVRVACCCAYMKSSTAGMKLSSGTRSLAGSQLLNIL